MIRLSFILYAMPVIFGACQKQPKLAASSDPLSPLSPPPMGAQTYNDELKRELTLLDDVLEQRLDQDRFLKLKKALFHGDKALLALPKHSDDSYLVKVFMGMPELLSLELPISAIKKTWFKAKLYFLNRRFIEAAMLLSEVIAQDKKFFEARNYQARAMFFLGNPDDAIIRLKGIIADATVNSQAGLDALYLIGAMSYEAHDQRKASLKEGVDAWRMYLKAADVPDNLHREVLAGIKEMEEALSGISNQALAHLDPFLPQNNYDKNKNAVLEAFKKDELNLALALASEVLSKQFDKELTVIKARILFKTGRHDEARVLYQEITKKHPKYAPGFHYQGMAFMMQGKPKEAIECWQKVIALNKSYGEKYGLEQRIKVAMKMLSE